MLANFKIKPLITWFVRFAGVAMILAAVWAESLGLDRGEGWGPARWFLLCIGALLILASVANFLVSSLDLGARYVSKTPTSAQGDISENQIFSPDVAGEAMESTVVIVHNKRRWATISASIFLFAGIIGLTWLISVGRWNEWPGTTDYFHLLADGFRAGQTHLLLEPDPRLLALPDPYNFENRKDIPHLWDATLYQGKYYLYWGPAPALVTVFLELITNQPVGDNLLVWLFSLGTYFWIFGILHTIYVQHFKYLPIWAFILAGLSFLFVNPFQWMVARPAVYEVAIQSAQFFFLGGLYWLLKQDVREKPSSRNMLLTGIFWALAVASRASLATVIIPLSCIVLFLMMRTGQSGSNRRRINVAMISFFLPLLIGAVMLAYYNYARFESFFELGHQYALSSWKMDANYPNFITSINNIGPNVYNYFLNPFRTLEVFPFIKPKWGSYSVPFLRMVAGSSYATEQVTGILISSPVVLFGVVPVILWLFKIWNNIDIEKQSRSPVNPFQDRTVSYIYCLLFLSVVLILFPLLIFHANSMRYMMDFMPTLMILSVVSYWSLLGRITRRRHLLVTMSVLIAGLSIYGGVVGFLLGITGQSARFEAINPDLFNQITRSLTW